MLLSNWAVSFCTPGCELSRDALPFLRVMQDSDYDKTLSLSSHARSYLQWVIEKITQCNGRLFHVPKIDIYIQSDASLIGWVAVSGSLSASGRWSKVNLNIISITWNFKHHFVLSSVLCLTRGPFMLDLQLTTPLQWPIFIIWGKYDPTY